MRRLIVVVLALLGLFLAAPVFGQDASLGGTVTDASGGVSVLQKNTDKEVA